MQPSSSALLTIHPCLLFGTRQLTIQGETLEEIDLGDAVGNVIGSGGSNIKTLQDSTGAKIDIPRGTTSCRVYGPKDAVCRRVHY